MADYVNVPELPDGPDVVRIDNKEVDYGGGDIRYRQRTQITGDAVGDAVQPKDSPVDGTEFALPTRNIEESAASATVTSVAQNAASVSLLAADATRRGTVIYNNAPVPLFVKLGAGASAASFTNRILGNGYWEVPFRFTGDITGIWLAAGAGAALITSV